MVDWQMVAESIALLEEADLESFSLSEDEREEVLTLFNRSVANARAGGADISMIALKKLLSRFPNWGEALLLFAVSLALEDNLARAKSGFDHVLKTGFLITDYTDLTSYCLREADAAMKSKKRAAQRQMEEGRGLLGRRKKGSIFSEKQEKTLPAQTPILTRAPKNAAKVRFATDVERRNIMMQAGAPDSESPDDDLEVDIPRTPAEKVRITVWILASAAVLAAIVLAVWFVGIPWFQNRNAASAELQRDSEKLEYLLGQLESRRGSAEVDEILESFSQNFGS